MNITSLSRNRSPVYGSRAQPYQIVNDYMRRRLNPYTVGQGPSVLNRRGIRGNLGRGRTRTLLRRKYRTRPGILGGTNADTRLVYRKKRMPAGRRRRWRRFVQKVNFVGERDLGTRTVLFNDQIQTGNTNDGRQGCLTLALYSFKNDSKGWLNDLASIGTLENTGNPTAAAGGTVDINTKIMFHSAVMDVTIRNTSVYNDGTSLKQVAEAALELDVYEVYMRMDSTVQLTNYTSLTGVFNSYDDKEIGGAGAGVSGINIEDRGATPFEFGAQMGRFGVKILKKTKYFIPNGQTITFQTRDPKRHVCRYNDLVTNDGWNRKGWTKLFYIVYKLVPGLSRGTSVGLYQDQITLGLTRKYQYKIEGFNEPRERLLGSTYAPGSPT